MHPLRPLAQKFRRQHTPAELLLWLYIRDKQLNGIKFKRQVPIGNYIADFVCIKHKLIIEIDGGQHNVQQKKQKDDERTKWFEKQGYKVIRFWNDEIINNIEGVLEVLHLSLPFPPLSSKRAPSSAPRGEEQKVVITKSSEETQMVAEQFVQEIQPGDIITLSGDLGAGKTTFTQGFAKGLDIENRIISPTFVIIRIYRNKNQESRIKEFYHMDLYRTQSEQDFQALGLKEILQNKDAVIVVEWPEKLGSYMPEKRWDIKIESLSETERKITIKKMSNS